MSRKQQKCWHKIYLMPVPPEWINKFGKFLSEAKFILNQINSKSSSEWIKSKITNHTASKTTITTLLNDNIHPSFTTRWAWKYGKLAIGYQQLLQNKKVHVRYQQTDKQLIPNKKWYHTGNSISIIMIPFSFFDESTSFFSLTWSFDFPWSFYQ